MENIGLNGISSNAVPSLSGYVDVFQQIEDALVSDVAKVRYLTQKGLLNNMQEQYLLNTLAQKANYLNLYKQTMPQQAASEKQVQIQPQQKVPQISPLDLFTKENPGFFDSESRADVLNYIKNLDMDKDEITKIAEMVKKLESNAVDSYLKKSAHEKSLNDENLAAKSKLIAYAQNAPAGEIGKIFTREDIGNMTGEEFTKNEKLIADQARQGLIK